MLFPLLALGALATVIGRKRVKRLRRGAKKAGKAATAPARFALKTARKGVDVVTGAYGRFQPSHLS
jgi:hypothetical protein